MIVLFDQSAKLNALPIGTGNKSERLFGYYTWHADDSPPINPLGDLFKTQVWALARGLDRQDRQRAQGSQQVLFRKIQWPMARATSAPLNGNAKAASSAAP